MATFEQLALSLLYFAALAVLVTVSLGGFVASVAGAFLFFAGKDR